MQISPITSEDEGMPQTSKMARVHRRQVGLGELVELKAEEAIARALNVAWQRRGPPGPENGGPPRWRGQRYRPTTGKWANRGGRNQEYYRQLYANKGNRKGDQPSGKGEQPQRGKGKELQKGKGKGKHGKCWKGKGKGVHTSKGASDAAA